MTPVVRVAIVGNPNCGKTSLFNALTGAHQKVGNWPGVTVDRKIGRFQHRHETIEVVDLPGVYSLGVATTDVAMDERIARDYIARREASLIVNIVDAANLERNLYLTAQLVEMQVPMIVVLNMMDAARKKGLTIDTASLAKKLGVPVVGVVATTGEGLEALKDTFLSAAHSAPIPSLRVKYAAPIVKALRALEPELVPIASARGISVEWLALKLLEDDAGLTAEMPLPVTVAVAAAKSDIAASGEDADILIADARYTAANDLIHGSVHERQRISRSVTDRIDAVVLNRVLGIPIFLSVIYLMFLFSINLGNAFIDFFDLMAGALLVDGLGALLTGIGFPDWLVTIVAGGAGGGIQTVATFIPVIGALFLFLSVLEDSGYMARAGFVMDRFMKSVGLPGNSFVPMMVGFGCTVPAVMATRTLANPRDRVLTAVMAHFMSCGARLPVYALFAAAFFPTGAQNVVFALYLIGIFFSVISGLLLKNTVLAGRSAPFLMELPLYHMPTLRGVAIRTWERLKSFVFKAGKFIVAVAIVLTFFNSLGRDGTFGNENTPNSVLAATGQAIIPVFEPMGIRQENWPAAVGLFTGFFAKEVVVGTLDALYSQMDGERTADEEDFDLGAAMLAAVATIPVNLADLANKALDPLGLDIAVADSIEEAAAKQEVSQSTFGAMAARFDGKLGAFAYLLVILLYSPCMSALSAYYRELSPRWMVFVATYATLLGYSVGVLVYQIGTFAQHPAYSTAWIGGILSLLAGGAFLLWFGGRRRATWAPLPAE